jgi:hypothetical protein
MRTLQEFYERMEHTRAVRLAMVEQYVPTSKVAAPSIQELAKVLAELEGIAEKDGHRELALDENAQVSVDLGYELNELKKDLVFFRQGEAALDAHLASLHQDFERVVKEAVTRLQGIRFNNFVTDRDGTISNYCGRYRSSIQSAYNAVFLTRFIQRLTSHAVVVTSAPLRDPGVATVSVMPLGTFIYAASKAREFLDAAGKWRSLPIDPAQQALLDRLNKRLSQLVAQPGYAKFGLIGSGLQFKFGETTLARQDISKTVPAQESEAFLQLVTGIVREIDPDGRNFGIKDTGLDIEVILKGATGDKAFDKADGLLFLNDQMKLGLEKGPTLVCGDTAPDLKLVEACLSKSSDVWAMFVTRDPQLAAKVHQTSKQAIVVPEVDMLVTVLNRLALGARG